MERKLTFSIGEYYHLYNRGVEKRDIFLEKMDSVRFQRLIYLANGANPIRFSETESRVLDSIDRGSPFVAVGAYVLMPNHFHILVKEIIENGLSRFMEKLATGYSMYFNKKYERVGPLFQGRFKGEHVDNDRYLKYLFSYIHLNPIKLIDASWKETGIKNKSKAVNFLEQYVFSSYQDYIGYNRQQNKIINMKAFPRYFQNPTIFKEEIFDWLDAK